MTKNNHIQKYYLYVTVYDVVQVVEVSKDDFYHVLNFASSFYNVERFATGHNRYKVEYSAVKKDDLSFFNQTIGFIEDVPEKRPIH